MTERRRPARARESKQPAKLAGERRAAAKRRASSRAARTDRRTSHPLASAAKLRPQGPALERRATPRQPARERLTINVPRDVADQLRDAVHATPGMTVGSFVSQCISDLVTKLEAERGSKFPRSKGRLPAGRPKGRVRAK